MNITIDLLSLMEEIRKKYPLQGDYEEDARYNWPDRWEALYEAAKRGVSKTPCYACGGKGVIYADGIAVNCVCNPVPNEDQSDEHTLALDGSPDCQHLQIKDHGAWLECLDCGETRQ